MTEITRRSALFTSVALLGVSTAGCAEKIDYQVAYRHGVASGDPETGKVIIWTRITTAHMGPVKGHWQISKNMGFLKLIHKGQFTTDERRDHTVKIDVTRLKSGTTYYYRFMVGDMVSPIGKTKTLPRGSVDKARFAVVSCSNLPFGLFNVYGEIAKHDHFDAVIHLGDYLYEYGRDGYGGKVGAKLGRQVEPAHEIITLADYRTRHAQYKADPQAQALHAASAFICIWDDHETANDSWKTGAQNHNEGEGSWAERRASAMRAYYEWMPVRDPAPGAAREALFRTYSFGDLLTLISIETRLTARTQPLDYSDHIEALQSREGVMGFVKNTLGAENREMLGGAQMDYIDNALTASKTNGQPWRVIANQVMMARIASPDLTPYKDEDFIYEIEKIFPGIHDSVAISPLGLPRYLDGWDGYPAARERFYARVQSRDVQDLLVLTGDTHECWANKLVTAAGTNMGVELGTTGVTSPGIEAYFGDAAADYSRRLNAKNDDVIYHNIENHGYIDLTLTRTEGRADFVSVDTIYSQKYKAFVSKSFKLEKSGETLKLKDA